MATAPDVRKVMHRDDALNLAIAQNPQARAYLVTDQWMRRTGIGPILRDDYPTYFAVLEDPPVKNGGRHEYGMRTLVCDRHVLNDGRRLHVRSGCGRRSPFPLERFDKEVERFRRFQVWVLGMAIGAVYMAEHDPRVGDWLPSWYRGEHNEADEAPGLWLDEWPG